MRTGRQASRTHVAAVMTPDPIMLFEDDSIHLGGVTLLRHGISGAPVMTSDNILVGVFSQSDVLARFAAPRLRRGPIARLDDRHAHAATVGDACSRPAAVISPEATIDTAARELLDRDIGRLIVVDRDEQVVGVISRSDILKLFLLGNLDDAAAGVAAGSLSRLEPD